MHKLTVWTWFAAHPAAAECARDYLAEGVSYRATVDHLQRRHGFPFKSPRALSDWGKSAGHYRGKHIMET